MSNHEHRPHPTAQGASKRPPPRCVARVELRRCPQPAVSTFVLRDRWIRPRDFCAVHAAPVREQLGRSLGSSDWTELPAGHSSAR